MRTMRCMLLLLVPVLCASCAHRTLTIESEPAGAEVFLDRKPVGTTPVTVPFRYGGHHEILLLPPPPQGEAAWRSVMLEHNSERADLDLPFFDGLAELTGTEDHQRVMVTLPPEDVAQRYERDPYRDRPSVLPTLLERAETLRSRSRSLFLAAPPRQPFQRSEEPEESPKEPEVN